MDERKQTLWERLTDWRRSPIYRFFRSFEISRNIERLHSINLDEREKGIIFFNTIKDPRLFIPLLKDSLCTDYAVSLIVKLASEDPKTPGLTDVVPRLIETLRYGSCHDYCKARIAYALGLIGDERAIQALNDIYQIRKGGSEAERALRSQILHTSRMFVWRKPDDDPKRNEDIREFVIGLAYEETLSSLSFRSLNEILETCRNVQHVEDFEKGLDQGIAFIKEKFPIGWERDDVKFRIVDLKIKAAKKKNQLAPDRGILITDIPKPPKKGTIYQQVRAISNG